MGMFGGAQLARARFYDDLATTLDAGLPVREALRTVADRGSREGAAALALEGAIRSGSTIAEAMSAEPAIWSVFERRIVEAGERGGRLPEALRRLAKHFEQRGNARDKVGGGLIYPVILAHLAFLLPPIKHLVVGEGLSAYAPAALIPLAIAWVVVLGLGALLRFARASETAGPALDAVTLRIPVVGPTARAIAIQEYASTLGTLYGSGIPVIEAMRSAAAATRNAAISAAAQRAADRVKSGERVHEAVRAELGRFSSLLAESVKVGDKSGKLDDALGRVEKAMADEVDRRIAAITAAVPALVFLLVAGMVAWQIVSTYAGIYEGIREAAG